MASLAKSMSWLLLALLLTAHRNASEGLRILGIFPLQEKSHFVMSERLMRGLAERGHQVDVYSHFPLKKPPLNYVDYSLTGTLPAFYNNMSYQFMNNFAGHHSASHILEILGNPVCELLDLPIFQKLIRDPPKYDLVIIETFMSDCYLAFGRHLNIPLINMVTSSALFDWMNEPLGNPQNLAVEPNAFMQSSGSMNFFERLQNVWISKFLLYSFNYHIRIQDNYVKKHFRSEFPSVVDLRRDVSLALINYHRELNGVKPLVPAVVPVGFMHVVDSDDDLPKGVHKFLDESRDGFIYLSFGSMVRIETFPKRVLDAFYATFEKIAPVRVLMKIAKPEELPAGLPSNVMTYHWLPQVKVLSPRPMLIATFTKRGVAFLPGSHSIYIDNILYFYHSLSYYCIEHRNIRAFVTHGGLMGTQEAIYYGVPMIGFPLFGDQHSNINIYVAKKLAIELDHTTVTEYDFIKAIEEILRNPVYRESARKTRDIVRDVPLKPIDEATFWVEYVARHGKNCLRSPIVDLPWWQASLLDVYAFIALVMLTVLYIIKILIVKVIRNIRTKQCSASNGKLKRN